MKTHLFVIFSILLYSFVCFAESEPTDLGAIVVRAEDERAHGTLVEYFDRKDFEETTDESIAEFIQELPSAEVTTGSRGESLIQLRGFDQKELVVLIDGVPSAIPFDGLIDLGKFPIDMVESIEVIKGAGSVVYGPGGLGGAINIITRSPKKSPKFKFTVDGSPVYQIRNSVVQSLDFKTFDYVLYGGYEYQSIFPLSNDFRTVANQAKGDRIGSGISAFNGGARFDFHLSENHLLSISGNAVIGRYDVPPSTVNRARYWRFKPWLASTVSLTHKGTYLSDRLEVRETIFASPFYNTLRSYDDASYSSQNNRGSFTSTYNDLTAGAFTKARLSFYPKLIQSLFARLWLGARFERHEETSVGGAGSTDYNHWLITAAPEIEINVNRQFSIKAGTQFDAEIPEQFAGIVEPKNHFNAGPFGSFKLRPTDSVIFELSFARRTRFPTLKERFADAFGQRQTNPNLGPEKAWHSSLDTTLILHKDFLIKIGLFDSEVQGLIVRETVAGGLYQLQNAGRARLAGVEAAIIWDIEDLNIKTKLGYEYLYARRLDESYPGSQLEYRPEHKGQFQIKWNFLKNFFISNNLIVVGERPYLDTTNDVWGKLDTNILWNMKVQGEILKDLRLWLSAKNILDRNNISEYGFPSPGRMIFAGMSYKL